MTDRPTISGRWGGRHAPLSLVEVPHDDDPIDPIEPALARAARLLDAQLTLTASVEREAALVRATLDARLARIEALLLVGSERQRVPTDVETDGREVVQIVRRRRVEQATCCVCAEPFTRRHPSKARCDACTHRVTRDKERARYHAKGGSS